MTGRYAGDHCPACGSDEVIPYAVIVGGSEEYGYQCLACAVTWPVLSHPDSALVMKAASHRHRALRENTDGKQEGLEGGRQAGLAARGRSPSPSSAPLTGSGTHRSRR